MKRRRRHEIGPRRARSRRVTNVALREPRNDDGLCGRDARRNAPRADRSAPSSAAQRDPDAALRSGKNAQVLLCSAAGAFAAALLAGQLVREARMHVAPGTAEQLTLGFLALGGALGLWLPRRIASGRAGAASAPSTQLAAIVFAGAAGTAALVAGPAGWIAARLERWRDWLATAFVLPEFVAVAGVIAPLAICAALLGATTAVTLAALHGWHRAAQRQRLHIAPLWIAWAIAVAAGSFVAYQIHDANRFWYVAPLLLLAAAGIAVVRRDPTASDGAAIAPVVDRSRMRAPIATAAALGTTLAAVLVTPGEGLPALETPVAMASGGALGVILSRLCVRYGIGAEFAPLGAILAAFVVLQGMAGGFEPTIAAAFSIAGLSLVGRQAALEARSIQRSLATIGAAAAAAFSIAAFVLSAASAAWGGAAALLLVILPACAALGIMLVVDRRRGRVARAACLSALALCLVTALAALVARSPARLDASAAAHPLRNPLVNDSTRVLELASARALLGVDLGWPAVETIVIGGGEAGVDAFESPLSNRVMRRLGRRLMSGGRVVLEQPLDPVVAQIVERYARKANPPLGPVFELSVRDETGRDRATYRALLIGRDLPQWIGGRGWPAGYDAELCPLPAGGPATLAADGGG